MCPLTSRVYGAAAAAAAFAALAANLSSRTRLAFSRALSVGFGGGAAFEDAAACWVGVGGGFFAAGAAGGGPRASRLAFIAATRASMSSMSDDSLGPAADPAEP